MVVGYHTVSCYSDIAHAENGAIVTLWYYRWWFAQVVENYLARYAENIGCFLKDTATEYQTTLGFDDDEILFEIITIPMVVLSWTFVLSSNMAYLANSAFQSLDILDQPRGVCEWWVISSQHAVDLPFLDQFT